MTKNLITIRAEETLAQAWRLMREKGIRHLPVLDERSTVVGILSDRDVQRAIRVQQVNGFQQELHLDDTLRVEDFMSWPVYVVHEDTSLRRVAEEMLSQKVSAFLVENSTGHLKGIITTDDLLKILLTESPKISDSALKGLAKYFSLPEVV